MPNESLRIAFVANAAWNLYNFRRGLMLQLQQAGYSIIAVAPADEYVEKLEAMGFTFVPLQKLSRKGTNPLQDYLLYRELKNIYHQQKIDLTFQYTIKPNIYGTWAASKLNIPSICTVTGLGYSFISTGWINRLAKWLYKQAFKRASAVVFQNSDDLGIFVETGLVAAAKTQLIRGSGIDTQYFCPMPKSSEDRTFTFLFVGRLLYDKGIIEYIEAAKILQTVYAIRVNCWIVGAWDKGNPSAIDKTKLDAYIASGWVHYFGASDDVRSFVQHSDVVVLPSYREGLPRVMLEGMAMAKPLITTDTAGCRETVLHEQNGYLVPLYNAQALADAMLRVFNLDDTQRQALGDAGRALALQEFDEQIIVKKYKELVAKLRG